MRLRTNNTKGTTKMTRLLDKAWVKLLGRDGTDQVLFTTDHPASSYGIPVAVPAITSHFPAGVSFGPGDVSGGLCQCYGETARLASLAGFAVSQESL